jgi:hypothetical protein
MIEECRPAVRWRYRRATQPARRDFGEEEGDAEADRHGDDHRDDGGDQVP